MPRALIIDDEPPVRRLLRAYLKAAGHEVVEAADGDEGLRLFRVQPAELVFCDVFMEGMDGFETIRQLRRESPAVRVVAMSGGGQMGWGPLPAALRLGADVALPKPFNAAQAQAAAAAAMRRVAGEQAGPAQ